MSTISLATPDELRAARARLIRESGLSEEELRKRGHDYKLDLRLISLLEEIDRIDYLLGE